jgi:hypothetical protein
VKLEIDLVAERRYQASVLSSNPLSHIPVGPETYFVIIEGMFRIPVEKKDAEALLTHMKYKESVAKSPGLSQPADRFRQALGENKAFASYPPEANIYKASAEPDSIPDPPSDDTDDDDEDEEDEDNGFSGTDDAGDGIGQY